MGLTKEDKETGMDNVKEAQKSYMGKLKGV